MNESQIDLAHAVALGSIGDEDQCAAREILDSNNPVLRADFDMEVQLTRQALTLFSSASATPPPAPLRERLLAQIAAEESVTQSHSPVHPGTARAESTADYPRKA
jgi:hypothetical protein